MRYGFGVNAVLLLDLGDLSRRAGQADDRRAEELSILAHVFGPIVFRVDGDEDDVHCIIARRLAPELHEPLQRRRAHVAATGEPEIDRIGFAGEAAAREWLAVGTDEHERAAEAHLASWCLRRIQRCAVKEPDRPGACESQPGEQPEQDSDLAQRLPRRCRLGHSVRTLNIASAASDITIAAASIVQIGWSGNNAFMIEPMTVATSS